MVEALTGVGVSVYEINATMHSLWRQHTFHGVSGNLVFTQLQHAASITKACFIDWKCKWWFLEGNSKPTKSYCLTAVSSHYGPNSVLAERRRLKDTFSKTSTQSNFEGCIGSIGFTIINGDGNGATVVAGITSIAVLEALQSWEWSIVFPKKLRPSLGRRLLLELFSHLKGDV